MKQAPPCGRRRSQPVSGGEPGGHMAIPDLAAGTLVLDRYRVLTSLPWGHAQRPAVLARDLRLAQHVDLLFSPAPAGTLAGDLFMRRAEAIAVLTHPALPPVL